MKFLPVTLLSFALSSACAIAQSASRPVSIDVVVTGIVSDGNTILGRYDPNGFTSSDAKKMAAFSCKEPSLASYGEVDQDGQKVFQATCRDGTKYVKGSGVNFKRTGSDTTEFFAVYRVNGQILGESGDFPL